jgi:hypothetical protein
VERPPNEYYTVLLSGTPFVSEQKGRWLAYFTKKQQSFRRLPLDKIKKISAHRSLG